MALLKTVTDKRRGAGRACLYGAGPTLWRVALWALECAQKWHRVSSFCMSSRQMERATMTT